MTSPASASGYDIDDPSKIQGRDEIRPGARDLAALRLDRALTALASTSGPLLLLGCGAGRYARALARARPHAVVAGDISKVAVREAVAAGGSPHYLVMDAQRLPFENESFDSVVFFDLLEHVPDPAAMLAECARVLRPGGVLHFFVPLEAQPRTLYHALRRDRPIPIHRWKRDHVGHIQRFDRPAVLALVEGSGLIIHSTHHSFHLVGQVHDIVDYWHRHRASGGAGRLPLSAVSALTRAIFLVTWRLSYLEDRLLNSPAFASGLHVTAHTPAWERKPASPVSQDWEGQGE